MFAKPDPGTRVPDPMPSDAGFFEIERLDEMDMTEGTADVIREVHAAMEGHRRRPETPSCVHVIPAKERHPRSGNSGFCLALRIPAFAGNDDDDDILAIVIPAKAESSLAQPIRPDLRFRREDDDHP